MPTRVLDHFAPKNAINVHPSLLPKYRGAAPIQWTIINGEQETGVTIQTLSKDKFDHGDILSQDLTVSRRIAAMGPRLMQLDST